MYFQPGFLIAGGVILLIALAFLWWGRSSMLKAKRIEDTPTTPCRNVRDGFVEVKGRVKGKTGLLTSPLAKVQCVYYRFHVEEQVRRGKNTYWETRIDDKQCCGLLIEDASQAHVEVNLLAADLILKPDAHAKSGFLKDATPELEATLSSYGHSSQGFLFNRTLRYTETYLEVGDEMYVLGTAQHDGGGGAVIDKGGDLFIVSDQSEEQLTRSFHNKKLGGFITGGVLGAVALALCAMSVVR
ncbi:MAG: hypothetical protein JNK82_12440 [Myxococcaceae bacterium]|nr:hypothetical protein [Myxococcaceae bacterium]